MIINSYHYISWSIEHKHITRYLPVPMHYASIILCKSLSLIVVNLKLFSVCSLSLSKTEEILHFGCRRNG